MAGEIIFIIRNTFITIVCLFFNLAWTFAFTNTIRVSNGLDPEQDRHSVGPDLGPNYLQRPSADDKSRC